MVLTPTYFVFKMYKVFHETTLLPIDLTCEDYTISDEKLKSINSCASINKDGIIHISLVNLNPEKEIEISCQINGKTLNKVSGEILTSEKINDFNDFGQAEKVKPETFKGAKISGSKLIVKLPSKSVIVLTVI